MAGSRAPGLKRIFWLEWRTESRQERGKPYFAHANKLAIHPVRTTVSSASAYATVCRRKRSATAQVRKGPWQGGSYGDSKTIVRRGRGAWNCREPNVRNMRWGDLYLVTSPSALADADTPDRLANWNFRFQRNGRVRDTGLGSYSSISFKVARQRATAAASEALGSDDCKISASEPNHASRHCLAMVWYRRS